MAIAKDIAIHTTTHMRSCLAYQTLDKKASLEAFLHLSETDKVFEYATNLDKTVFRLDGDEDVLSSGIDCTPDTASIMFQQDKELYEALAPLDKRRNVYGSKIDYKTGKTISKESIEAYHIIQSFAAIDTLDPRVVHNIGIEFCKRAFPGHRCVIATHLNTGHLHNHIVMCAYHENGTHKFHMNKTSRRAYRAINDEISIEHNLPIILQSDIEHREDLGNAHDRLNLSDRKISELPKEPGTQNNILSHPGKTPGYTDIDYVSNEYIRPDHYQKSDRIANSNPIDLSRYTESGRRRSDIELIILRLIKHLRELRDLILAPDTEPGKTTYTSYTNRINQFESALMICEKHGISSADELSSMLNDTGASLSHSKKEHSRLNNMVPYADHVLELIDTYDSLSAEAAASGISCENLPITVPSPRKVQHNRAAIMPMTPAQKRELYLLLSKQSEYTPGYKYEDIDYISANSIISYLKGQGERPELPLMSNILVEGASSARFHTVMSENQLDEYIKALAPNEQELIRNMVDCSNKLAELGYDPSCLANTRSDMVSIKENVRNIQADIRILSKTYHDLANIKKLLEDPVPEQTNRIRHRHSLHDYNSQG